MELILLERVAKLGQMGDRVVVANGYARNFLLPKKKAMRATKSNIAQFEAQKAQLETQNIKRRDDAKKAAKSLEGVVVTLIRQSSDTGQLYGSVRSGDITEQLAAQNITALRSQVDIPTPIKHLGVHLVHVHLHPEVHATIYVNVAQSQEEAEVQLDSYSAE